MTNDVRLIELCCHRSTKRLLAVVDSFRRLTPVGWYSFTISKYHKTEYYLSDSDRTGPKKKSGRRDREDGKTSRLKNLTQLTELLKCIHKRTVRVHMSRVAKLTGLVHAKSSTPRPVE